MVLGKKIQELQEKRGKILLGGGVIIGSGAIYDAPVAIFARDFTVAGGSLG